MSKYRGTAFICEMDSATQARIFDDLAITFECIFRCPSNEMRDALDNAMCCRICDLDETINIDPYTI